MKRSRFSEEQIIVILKQQESGVSTADVCREHGISSATFYKWKAKFGGLEVSDARRLKALEEENAKLKKLLAEQGFSSRLLLQNNFSLPPSGTFAELARHPAFAETGCGPAPPGQGSNRSSRSPNWRRPPLSALANAMRR